jgi:hypothetical protein
MLNYKGHTYLLEKEGDITCITLVHSGTGNIFSDVIGSAYYGHELEDALEDLIAEGEDCEDREAEDAIASL